jgi:hypothetical protein
MSGLVDQLPIYGWVKSKEATSLAYGFVSKWDTALVACC